MALKIGNSRASVTVTGADERIMLDLLDAAIPGLRETIEAASKKVRDDAYDAWPKPGDPGYDSSRSSLGARNMAAAERGSRRFIPKRTQPSSADGLEYEVSIDLDTLVMSGRVFNNVSYAKFIKANSLGGRSAFVRLIRTPMRKAGRKLARDIADRMIEELNNG